MPTSRGSSFIRLHSYYTCVLYFYNRNLMKSKPWDAINKASLTFCAICVRPPISLLLRQLCGRCWNPAGCAWIIFKVLFLHFNWDCSKLWEFLSGRKRILMNIFVLILEIILFPCIESAVVFKVNCPQCWCSLTVLVLCPLLLFVCLLFFLQVTVPLTDPKLQGITKILRTEA